MASELEAKLEKLRKRRNSLSEEIEEEKKQIEKDLEEGFKKYWDVTSIEFLCTMDEFLGGFSGEIATPVNPRKPVVSDYLYREELNKIRDDYQKFKAKTDAKIQDVNKQIRFIEGAFGLSRASLIVEKSSFSLIDSRFYSLWIANSPVFLYEGKKIAYLHTKRKDNPLEIRRVDTKRILGDDEELAASLLNLEKGSFCNGKGYVIDGENEEIVANIFEQVLTGKKILPRPKTPTGYAVKTEQRHSDRKTEIKFRHWGQIYVAQSGPDKITEGQLLGSGGSYKAYTFGNNTVVEFDQPNRATYLFDSDYFNKLRIWYRSDLLTRKPEGFEGRIIHHDNRDAWKASIDDFLSN